jgi:hypothetical protein
MLLLGCIRASVHIMQPLVALLVIMGLYFTGTMLLLLLLLLLLSTQLEEQEVHSAS